ncbi:sensor histidine kinase [Bifidobacterium jacchi]|uniref:histidine kinase n=1 Tax=Bifidobacterium jacchi TaxID=2490545 RepID=A0A5N5RF64_9BIFI|nr:HAMP domain-containing sensor histidine kinase [Bifidobacterium jacchi]KAB5605897.1 sensor histidine kinase [Bifidobacterium jacchi]
MLVLLIVGVTGISLSIRQLVGNYLLDKTDKQLIEQKELVVRNTDLLRSADANQNTLGLNSYYMQVRDVNSHILGSPLSPLIRNAVKSTPVLPTDGSMGDISFGELFTTDATVTVQPGQSASHTALSSANAPWRVLCLQWVDSDGTPKGVIYLGLSLADAMDTVNTLTRYCIMVGMAVVLLGGVIGTLVVQRTLTPLKRIEKTAAKIAAGDLSQRVPSAPENTEVGSLSASLNAMLARIEQSFNEQQETTEKMKRFVSDASHELRTPLAAIHGYAELYKMQRDMPGALERADESIEHIEASSTRMTVLVEDLLSLARLDEGRGIDITQQVPLTSLVSDATDDLHALDPERAIRKGVLTLDKPEQGGPSRFAFEEGDLADITLKGDGSRLRQVVTNIVGNIHRYTPSDSPVEVSLSVMPASISPQSLSHMPSTERSLGHLIEAIEVGQSMQVGMNYAIMRISDHGPGVPQESRARIFERFYTADPSRARLKGGTGLGMAIAQSVVKAHHGFICASGSDGGGLTLTVVLPMSPVEPRPTNAGVGGQVVSASPKDRQRRQDHKDRKDHKQEHKDRK